MWSFLILFLLCINNLTIGESQLLQFFSSETARSWLHKNQNYILYDERESKTKVDNKSNSLNYLNDKSKMTEHNNNQVQSTAQSTTP